MKEVIINHLLDDLNELNRQLASADENKKELLERAIQEVKQQLEHYSSI